MFNPWLYTRFKKSALKNAYISMHFDVWLFHQNRTNSTKSTSINTEKSKFKVFIVSWLLVIQRSPMILVSENQAWLLIWTRKLPTDFDRQPFSPILQVFLNFYPIYWAGTTPFTNWSLGESIREQEFCTTKNNIILFQLSVMVVKD